jgi:hypothetical protein
LSFVESGEENVAGSEEGETDGAFLVGRERLRTFDRCKEYASAQYAEYYNG